MPDDLHAINEFFTTLLATKVGECLSKDCRNEWMGRCVLKKIDVENGKCLYYEKGKQKKY